MLRSSRSTARFAAQIATVALRVPGSGGDHDRCSRACRSGRQVGQLTSVARSRSTSALVMYTFLEPVPEVEELGQLGTFEGQFLRDDRFGVRPAS